MYKIVIVGSDHQAALEHIYKSELISLGYKVQIFPAQTYFLEFYVASLVNKIYFRLGLSTIIKKIQKKLKTFIVDNRPSLVIIFKGMEITPETLLWIKNKGIKICNYNPDHPFVFSGLGSGNANISRSIKLYDYYFSYADDAVNNLVKFGVKSRKIPFGFDSNGFKFKELEKENEVLKICFLGNADKYRAKFINELGLDIDVFGENWNDYKMNDGVTIFTAKYGLDFWITLQKYAVQLNLLRPHNYASHNMRTFDIPGAGGIMLAPKTLDHQKMFADKSEVFLFNDVNDAVRIANQLLGLTFQERNIIRYKARYKCLKFHTYRHRVVEFISHMESEII